MRRGIRYAFLLFILAALVVVYALEKGPHSFRNSECDTCHVKDSAGHIVRELKAPVALLCMRCHEKIFTEGFIHPINVKPVRTVIPSDMPLSPEGEITCNTCHDVHAAYLTPYGTTTHFLRRLQGRRDFCAVCHGRSVYGGTGRHNTALNEAHFRSRYVAESASQEIDPTSKNCISCHDGAYATSVTIKAGSWTHANELVRYDMGNHPIGMDYEAARLARGSKTDLRPMSTVDRRVRFFNGKVGCGSCHDPYSSIEKRLVMSDAGSKLCFACHLVNRG